MAPISTMDLLSTRQDVPMMSEPLLYRLATFSVITILPVAIASLGSP